MMIACCVVGMHILLRRAITQTNQETNNAIDLAIKWSFSMLNVFESAVFIKGHDVFCRVMMFTNL